MSIDEIDIGKMIKDFESIRNCWLQLSHGSEDEILHILQGWMKTRDKCIELMNDNAGLRQVVHGYEQDLIKSRKELDAKKLDIANMRLMASTLLTDKSKIEDEHDKLVAQLTQIQELLRDVVLPGHVRDGINAIPKAVRRRAGTGASAGGGRESTYSILSADEVTFDQSDDADKMLDGGEEEDLETPRQPKFLGQPSVDSRAKGNNNQDANPVQDNELETSMLRNGRQWVRADPSEIIRKRSRSASSKRATRTAGFGPEPSAPPMASEEDLTQPRKRSKGEHDGHKNQFDTMTASVKLYPTINQASVRLSAGRGNNRRSTMNRSLSEPHLASAEGSPTQQYEQDQRFASNQLAKTKLFQSCAALSTRLHHFDVSSVYMPVTCSAASCGKRIAFGRKLYTCLECKEGFCEDCRLKNTNCVPKASTPRRMRKGYLADFTPTTSPMIPHLLIHCITEIEKRGLEDVGLYRVPGSEAQVVKLTQDFLWGRNKAPNLVEIGDTHVLTGCIKRFLSWLKEPIIPHSAWHEFSRAAFAGSMPAVRAGIVEAVSPKYLPQPNRETLAYLMIHFQNVAAKCETNKMPITNLATLLGSTVIGNSTEAPTEHQMYEELPKINKIMLCLLEMPPSFWSDIINPAHLRTPLLGDGGQSASTATLKTPDNLPGRTLRFNTVAKLYPDADCETPTNRYFQDPLSASILANTAFSGGSIKANRNKRFFKQPWK